MCQRFIVTGNEKKICSKCSEKLSPSQSLKEKLMCCDNCCRDGVPVQTYIDDGNLQFRKALCMIKKKKGIDQSYDLCTECYTMLRLQGYHWSNCWPAFLWFLLRQPHNWNAINYMWAHLLPESLRQTWRRSFQEVSSMHFEINTNNSNSPIIQDITPIVVCQL
jgi:hypothetical protein